MLFLIVVAVVWLVGAGFFQPIFSQYLAALCDNCSQGEVYELKQYDSYGMSKGSKTMEPGMGHTGSRGLALIWPVAAPYVFANMIASDQYKTGRDNIKAYWQHKRICIGEEKLRKMEIEAGIR